MKPADEATRILNLRDLDTCDRATAAQIATAWATLELATQIRRLADHFTMPPETTTTTT